MLMILLSPPLTSLGSKHTQVNQVLLRVPGTKLHFLCLYSRWSYQLRQLFSPSCCLFLKLRHEVACGQFIPFCCCILFHCVNTLILSTDLQIDGYLGCLVSDFGTIAAVNIHSRDRRSHVLILLKPIHKVKCGVMCFLCFTFWETAKPYSKEAAPFFVPTVHFPPLTKHSLFSVSFVRNIPMSVK